MRTSVELSPWVLLCLDTLVCFFSFISYGDILTTLIKAQFGSIGFANEKPVFKLLKINSIL